MATVLNTSKNVRKHHEKTIKAQKAAVFCCLKESGRIVGYFEPAMKDAVNITHQDILGINLLTPLLDKSSCKLTDYNSFLQEDAQFLSQLSHKL